MKILACHNFYQQPGGEDVCFADEAALLRAHGHEVVEYTRHNDDVADLNRLQLAADTIYNRRTYREIAAIIRDQRPDVLHCTNIFPLISPAVYAAAREHGVPVVQALHNYRLICPKATFLRNDRICESCLGKAVPWPAVRHGCYRDSRLASGVVAAMLTAHRVWGTWNWGIQRYYALTHFAREKFVQAGLPAKQIDVKPNFVSGDPGAQPGEGGYAVFVGRLSPEKGIDTLLAAWSQFREGPLLKIVGDGPLAPQVAAAAESDRRIEWLGHRPAGEVLETIGQASFLVMPSIWYETFGRTIIEAFAVGTPVIASRLGAMQELVQDCQNGLLFRAGDAEDLCRAVRRMAALASQRLAFRAAARRAYVERYTAECNYRKLVSIYERAIRSATARRPAEGACA